MVSSVRLMEPHENITYVQRMARNKKKYTVDKEEVVEADSLSLFDLFRVVRVFPEIQQLFLDNGGDFTSFVVEITGDMISHIYFFYNYSDHCFHVYNVEENDTEYNREFMKRLNNYANRGGSNKSRRKNSKRKNSKRKNSRRK